MKANVKKIIKITFLTGIIACFFVFAYITLLYITSPVKFDSSKISDKTLSISVYDNKNMPIAHTLTNTYISLNQIPESTIDCFISIEDKQFYKHKGINPKRIVAACVKNLTSLKFKEGASTISQQLIKNTHLTNEKTIKRKLNEIKLTKKLEKTFTKNQILEYYLNIIYFGDNCYGIQDASEHYFSKSASKLTLDESAMLAGLIKSPNKYHPIKAYENSILRRNLVLKELKKDGKISIDSYESAINTKTQINLNSDFKITNDYIKSAIKEAEKILKMPEKQIAIGGFRIYTYLDEQKQNALLQSMDKTISEDIEMISMNAKTAHIEAYCEKSNLPLINMKRQPASAIKPIIVYAPAINENIITPSTEILDERVSINGYEPKNIGEKEYGYVSAKTALSKSLNIPAVKILSYVGLDKAQNYAAMQNIEFDERDKSLAVALGGMTYGTNLKTITNAYQTLSNHGNHINSSFISHIVDSSGKVIYKNENSEKRVFRDDTAFLVTDMLHDSVKNGTAKRMSDLPFYVASKTGTSSNQKRNIDAYNISYTTSDVVGCWVGNVDNSPTTIVGGGKPTVFVKQYLSEIYKQDRPENFKIPSSIVELDIDALALQNDHVLYKANNYLPDRYKIKAYFSRFNEPKSNLINQLTLKPVNIEGMVSGGVADICFDADMYYSYALYEVINNKKVFLQEISNQKGKTSFKVQLLDNNIHTYFVKVKAKNYAMGEEIESEESNYLNLIYN